MIFNEHRRREGGAGRGLHLIYLDILNIQECSLQMLTWPGCQSNRVHLLESKRLVHILQ